jgi:paraquat-inducible protein B
VFTSGNALGYTRADVAQFEFTGLDRPLTRAGQRGTRIVYCARMMMADLSLPGRRSAWGLEVGYLETRSCHFDDGTQVVVTAFVETYDRRITTSTRFWDTSSFVSFGATVSRSTLIRWLH